MLTLLENYCASNLDCNGIVRASNLLSLLAAWGSCVGCPADLDCDGVVGASDVLQLLGAWGTCETAPPPVIPKTVQDCYNRFFPNDLEALIACIEAIE